MDVSTMTMAQVETRLAEIKELINSEDADLDALEQEIDALENRKAEINAKIEKRNTIANKISLGGAGVVTETINNSEDKTMPSLSEEFRNTNHMSVPMFCEERSILVSSGKLATPKAVGTDIGELPNTISSIVDDVTVIDATGTGSWDFAYKKTDAIAADVTEGQTIGGTGATFDKVTISPAIVGVLDEISNQVKKMSPVSYATAVRNSAYLALRKAVKDKIVAALNTSTLVEARTITAIDEKFIRNLVLGFNADESVASGTKLYISKTDLATLGDVRGTNEKQAVFDIEFEDENNGIIKDGGTAVKFSILNLTPGTMYYGQPAGIKLLLWDNYEVSTDDGGDYFKRNMVGIRGLQTAGADLAVYHGMQKITVGE